MSYAESFRTLKETHGVDEAIGMFSTSLSSVHFFWVEETVLRAPMLCPTGLIIIGEGRKIGYLDGRRFEYDENNYLIASVPTAFECETPASKENPLLGLHIHIDLARLHRLVEKVEKHSQKYSFKNSDLFCGLEPAEMDVPMQQATEKLLSCLQSPLDSDVLGQACVDEVIYRALLGEHGKALVALTKQETHHARIARSLSHIHQYYRNEISVDDLAEKVNMSASSFYRTFKSVTGESPLQYLKKTRLNNARTLILHEGLRVSAAADEVGYKSISQFSREFKRYFKVSPKDAKSDPYAALFQ